MRLLTVPLYCMFDRSPEIVSAQYHPILNIFVVHTCTCSNVAFLNSISTRHVVPLWDYQSIISFKPLLGLKYDEIILFPLPVLRKYYVWN